MPTPEKRVRVERGLYKTGDRYYACATPPGSRSATCKALGFVNLIEARRLRDGCCAEVQGSPAAPAPTNPRATSGEIAAEWLVLRAHRVQQGEMSPRTYEIYELALR